MMPDDMISKCKGHPSHPAVPSMTIRPSGPMTVLSSAPAGIAWHRASIAGVALAYGVIFTAFPSGVTPSQNDFPLAPIELVQVPADPKPDPAPQPEPPSAEAAKPDPVPVQPLPDPPVAGDAEVVPEKPPTTPPDPAPAATLADQSATVPEPAPPTPPLPEQATPLPKPARPRPRFVAPHPPAARTEPQTAAVPSARPSQADVATTTLTARIRDAVQAAVQCPGSARMMDQSGTAGVAFDYRDGMVVGGVQLTQSTGVSVLDAAALAAVRNAHYPQAPSMVPNQVLHLLVWVEEACGN
jgi:periplasmic protein TonB